MIIINGITLDGWIENKWGGEINIGSGGLKSWDMANVLLPDPLCSKGEEQAKIQKSADEGKVVYAIDGSKYIVRCGALSDISSPQLPSGNVTTTITSAKAGDIILLEANVVGNCIIVAIDNYGKFYTITKSQVIDVKITDEWDKYIFKWRVCYGDSAGAVNIITIPVSSNPFLSQKTNTNTKRIRINTCSSAQAMMLQALLGQSVSVSDTEVSFSGILSRIDLRYIADDMSDVETKQRQGVDIYAGTVEVTLT
ncbi:hypothetical protein [Hydrogenobacter thermophilus]|uniref:hypothetical protein n=1 Tax=Hydrogenobacter thermophilus TaxID=940 RepID=UPI0030FBDA98